MIRYCNIPQIDGIVTAKKGKKDYQLNLRGKYIYLKAETIPGKPFENRKLFPRKLRPSQGDIH